MRRLHWVLYCVAIAVAVAASVAAYCFLESSGSKSASATDAAVADAKSDKSEKTSSIQIEPQAAEEVAEKPVAVAEIKAIPVKARIPASLMPLYEHAREFILDGNWTRLLSVADVYKNGAYPEFVPDEDMALRLYHLCASCPDAEVAGLGQSRYIELRLDPLPIDDRFGSRLPPEPGILISVEARDRLSKTPYNGFATPVRARIAGLERKMTAPDTPPRSKDRRPVKRHHLSDAQNVHDHGVSSAVRNSIGTLLLKHGAPTPQRIVEAEELTRDGILVSGETETVKMHAMEVLDGLRNTPHSGFGVSESEVLALTVQEIESGSQRSDLWETLVKQLSTGVESGIVVCSSGKITRIMGVFDGTETFVDDAKPMWAVRDEIGTLAAQVRREFPDDARAVFCRRAEEEYIGRLGMSKLVMSPIIDEYANAL